MGGCNGGRVLDLSTVSEDIEIKPKTKIMPLVLSYLNAHCKLLGSLKVLFLLLLRQIFFFLIRRK